MTRIGVVSDTHGLMRPEVLQVFRGVDLILHAGDIGTPEVLQELRSVAPVIAVRGNNDKGRWAHKIPQTEVAHVGGVRIYLLHDLKELSLSPSSAGFLAVVSGHSHRPSVEEQDGVLFLNPGSAGPRRFTLPISIARLNVERQRVSAELIELPVRDRR
jgi:putative phosphoesterase